MIPFFMGCSKFHKLVSVRPTEDQKIQAITLDSESPSESANQEATDIFRYLVAQKYSFEGKSDKAAAVFRKMLANHSHSTEVLNAAATEEMNLSHYDESLALFEKSISIDPNNRIALESKARILTEKGDFSTALAIYANLLGANPEDEDLVDAMVQIFITREDLLPAERLIKAFLVKNPGNEYALFRLGMIQRASGKVVEARKTLEGLLEAIPDSFQAAAQLARVYDDLGEKEKSLELYEWLARSTNNPNYHWMLALMYTELKRFDKAIQSFENLEKTKVLDDQTKLMMLSVKAHQQVDLKNVVAELRKLVAKSPQNDSIKAVLAEVYQMDGQSAAAEEVLAKIDSKDRNFGEVLSSRMKLLFELKRNKELIELLDSLDLEKVVLDKNSERIIRTYSEVAYYYSKVQLFPKAHSVLDRGLHLVPTSQQLKYMRGLVFEKQDLQDKAVTAMEAVIALNAKHAAALNFVGYSLAERGIKLDKAEIYIRRALSQEPQEPYMLDSLGWVLFRRGRLKEALDHLSKAHQALPKESIVASHLGDVYLRLGDANEARRLFKMALELGPDKESEKVSLENKLAALPESNDRNGGNAQNNRLPSVDKKPCVEELRKPSQAGSTAVSAPCAAVELREPKNP